MTPVFAYGIIQPGFEYELLFTLMMESPSVAFQRFKLRLTLPSGTGWVEWMVSALEVGKIVGSLQNGIMSPKCFELLTERP